MIFEPIKTGEEIPPPQMMSAKDLMETVFAPLRSVIAGYLVEGLTILAGAPKAGKSWMALHFAWTVASGGSVFGAQVEQGDVLYLALEDNFRRIQDRLRGMGVVQGSERLTLATEWPSLEDDCMQRIEAWADGAPSPRLVVIDVYARVKGGVGKKENHYDADYRWLKPLQQFAIAKRLALLLIHHTRKQSSVDPFDAISGTRGINGSADTLLVLGEAVEGQQPVLYGRGRDIAPFERTMEFDPDEKIWRIVGEGTISAKSAEQSQILRILGQSESAMSPTQLAKALGKERSNVQKLIGRLQQAGQVCKVSSGKYQLRQSL